MSKMPVFKDRVVNAIADIEVDIRSFSIHELHEAVNKALDGVNRRNVDNKFDIDGMRLCITGSDYSVDFEVMFQRTQTVAEQVAIYEKAEADKRAEKEAAAKNMEKAERATYERLKKKYG